MNRIVCFILVINIYIYIYRERERERERGWNMYAFHQISRLKKHTHSQKLEIRHKRMKESKQTYLWVYYDLKIAQQLKENIQHYYKNQFVTLCKCVGTFKNKSINFYKQILRPHLVREFKHMFSVFKQHYTYFYTLFHPHLFPKKLKTIIQIHVPNGL